MQAVSQLFEASRPSTVSMCLLNRPELMPPQSPGETPPTPSALCSYACSYSPGVDDNLLRVQRIGLLRVQRIGLSEVPPLPVQGFRQDRLILSPRPFASVPHSSCKSQSNLGDLDGPTNSPNKSLAQGLLARSRLPTGLAQNPLPRHSYRAGVGAARTSRNMPSEQFLEVDNQVRGRAALGRPGCPNPGPRPALQDPARGPRLITSF